MSKVLIELFLPAVDGKYDVFVPWGSRIHEVQRLLCRAIPEISGGLFLPTEETVLCDRLTGDPLPVDRTVEELNIKNGTKLMLI
jgi:hypothetical protein